MLLETLGPSFGNRDAIAEAVGASSGGIGLRFSVVGNGTEDIWVHELSEHLVLGR